MKRKTIIGSVIAIAVVGLGSWALVNNSSKNHDQISVSTAKVKKADVTETLSTTGTLISNATTQLMGTGTVTDLKVKVGDNVKKNQVLATYDSGLELKADRDSTVTEINIQKDQADTAAQTGKASIVLADLSNLKVELALSNSEARQVALEQKATISSDGEEFAGHVTDKDPTATIPTGAATGTGSATLAAGVSFDKVPKNLYAGFSVDVDIETGSVKDALTIPIEALTYNDDNQPIVYVIEKGTNDTKKVKIIKVKTGIQSDTTVEIKDGLSDGQQVVLSPTTDLKDDSTVTVE